MRKNDFNNEIKDLWGLFGFMLSLICRVSLMCFGIFGSVAIALLSFKSVAWLAKYLF